ncbi:ELO family [Mucor mucedo]|uniref:ELO family n=1 Tax=Mucor mucedo TaxID=29922 RepID=UPI0022204554|nr:ELO family [Mucor mucedo]KAI7892422.1 ELO family [Mucor mucedo]
MYWNLAHLNPATASQFQWVYGITPMSDLTVIYTSWIVYFVSIVSIRWYMAERTRIDRSHTVLVFYNGSMILCSVYICMTASYSLWQTVNKEGQFFTFCHAVQYARYPQYGGYMFYSMYQYYLIRYYVFLDTKSIPFLHWYQHMFIILMMWSWLQDQSIFGSIATSIISFVQVFKYLYYFCNCTNIKSKWIKNAAVLFQVIQFIVAIALTAYQMSLCPQSNCVLLSASINITMVYMVVKYYENSEGAVATTREHYKRRNSNKNIHTTATV